MWILTKWIDIWHHRELLINLVKRDLKTRYKMSILGFFWSLLRPLFMMLIFTVVFSQMFRWDIQMNVPYPVFLLAAILPWQLLANSVGAGANTLLVNQNLIKKVSLPREIFPLSTVIAEIINFGLSLIVLFPFIIAAKISITPWLLILPVVFIMQCILVFGITLIVSSLNVFFRDTLPLTDLGMQAWFYLSPVFYPVSFVQGHLSPLLYKFYLLNPMCVLLTGYRKSLLESGYTVNSGFGTNSPEWIFYLGITSIFSITILLIGMIIFHYFDRKLADTL